MQMQTPPPQRIDTLIIGAGATGLSTALHLSGSGRSLCLVEANDRVGGNIGTIDRDGWRIEQGPNSLMENPALRALIDQLDLGPEVVQASGAAKKRYVVKQGKPTPLPSHPLTLLTSPLFGLGDLFHLAREPWIGRADREETIAEFVRRRLGQGFLDWAIDPFVSGVYAGDPNRLSVRAATPKIYALEQEHGSLIRGALHKMKARRAEKQASGKRADNQEGLQTTPSGRLISFRHGLSQLVDTMAEQIGADDGSQIHTGTRIVGLSHDAAENDAAHPWTAETADGRQFWANRLVLAVPAHVAADLLAPLDASLGHLLEEIVYPAVASVALGFDRHQVGHPLDGFGMLIPSRERHRTLGVLFSSTLFAERAPDGHVLLTAFIGGRRDTEAAEGSERDIAERVLADLRPLLGIRGEPSLLRVQTWPRAIPQYERGHIERIAAIDQQLAALPGLHLVGNWRDGIAVGDCLENGRKLARRLQDGMPAGAEPRGSDTAPAP